MGVSDGWGNWRKSRAYRAVDSHVRNRLRQWLYAKHQVQGHGTARWPDETLYGTLGLVRLERLTRNLPWAKSVSLAREPQAGLRRAVGAHAAHLLRRARSTAGALALRAGTKGPPSRRKSRASPSNSPALSLSRQRSTLPTLW